MADTAEAIDFRLDTEHLFAEVVPQQRLVETVTESLMPSVFAVDQLESDVLTRHRASRFIGEVLLGRSVQESQTLKHEKPINSLLEGIHWAAEGDADGLQLVATNVETDMIERTLKVGHVMDPVPLKVLPGSKIMQYNQTGDTIQTNSLQHSAGDAELAPRTKAETYNHFRDEALHREGWYKEHSKLVISLAGNNPDIFFTDTMSCSLQLTSKDGEDLQLETAFVAGVTNPGAERHDIDTVIAMGDAIGVDFRGLTIDQIIGKPIMIHNSLIPNGAIDVVEKLWDPAASQVLGRPAFFGDSKPAPCSYAEYLERCRERTQTFRPRAALVCDQLISERGQIKTRSQAIERLHQLSEEQMVHKAVEDRSINPHFLGPEAADHVRMARWYEDHGHAELAKEQTVKAIQTADSKSCPWAKSKNDEAAETSSNEATNESDADCDFISKECPKCGAKDVKTKVRSLGHGKGRRVSGSCGCVKTYSK